MRRLLYILLLTILAAPLGMAQDTVELQEARVKVKRERYRRKGNPAVDLMRRVIEGKQQYDWHAQHEYTSQEKYSKVVFSLNDVNPHSLERENTRLPLSDHIEVCNATGKLILPVTMMESVTQQVWRRSTHDQKDILLGQRHSGLDDLLDVGDITATGLADLFTDVNVMDDDIRLLQHQITSPLSRRTALSFYHYFIEDTLAIDGMTLYEVSFTPANPQDFGFSGMLLITASPDLQLHYASLSLPHNTGVNWVESLRISQSFTTLPSGERVLASDDMLLELRIVEKMQKFLVQRSTSYSLFSTAALPDALFRQSGERIVHPEADVRDDAFWLAHRPDNLTHAEDQIDYFKQRLLAIKGLKPVVWLARALATNSIPLSVKPGKSAPVDIAPVNTIISSNPVENVRLRLSLRTTAALSPHFFLRGYAAYGFGDHKWKGLGEMTYSINRKKHIPAEFPVHNITATYQRDLASPSDRFLNTDKDNVFTSLKWAKTEYMMYLEMYRLLYEREWRNGLHLQAQIRRETDRPAGQLQFLRTDSTQIPSVTYSEASIGICYRPGAKYYTSKQGRHTVNEEAPLYSLTHTMGLPGILGSQYRYNFTEAEIYRRFQLNSWGHLDMDLRGGIQWNRVPFPLLIMPATNLSYIKQKNTFSLINNMELLSDRYASLMLSWDLQGKLFNRIPLLRRLKWREFLGVNVLWGMLSSKNDPTAPGLMLFPEGVSHLEARRPYVEGIIGIHNILRILHLEYVHRFTYTDLPTAQRWGIRFRIDLKF